MKHFIFIALFQFIMQSSIAGEHEDIKYKTVSITFELPKPYGDCEFKILCNKSGSGDFLSCDTSRIISDIRLISKFGIFIISRNYFTDLQDPGFPNISHFLTSEGLAIFIGITGYDKNQKKCNLVLKIIDNKIVNKEIKYINHFSN